MVKWQIMHAFSNQGYEFVFNFNRFHCNRLKTVEDMNYCEAGQFWHRVDKKLLRNILFIFVVKFVRNVQQH